MNSKHFFVFLFIVDIVVVIGLAIILMALLYGCGSAHAYETGDAPMPIAIADPHNFDGYKEFVVPTSATEGVIQMVASIELDIPEVLTVCVFDKDLYPNPQQVTFPVTSIGNEYNEHGDAYAFAIIEFGGIGGIGPSEIIPVGMGFYRTVTASSVRVYINVLNPTGPNPYRRHLGAFIAKGEHSHTVNHVGFATVGVGGSFAANPVPFGPFSREVRVVGQDNLTLFFFRAGFATGLSYNAVLVGATADTGWIPITHMAGSSYNVINNGAGPSNIHIYTRN